MNAQLELGLSDVRKAVPWGGRSPRSLTRVRKALFLRQEPQKDACFFVDQNQIDMFPEAIEGPPQYGGAPLLVPLKEEKRHVLEAKRSIQSGSG